MIVRVINEFEMIKKKEQLVTELRLLLLGPNYPYDIQLDTYTLVRKIIDHMSRFYDDDLPFKDND